MVMILTYHKINACISLRRTTSSSFNNSCIIVYLWTGSNPELAGPAMHSEGHIVAHLHITEIEHDHGVHVTSDDHKVADSDLACSNPGRFLELPHRLSQCSNGHTPSKTPSTTSTSGLLGPHDSSESSLGSSVIIRPVARQSPRPTSNESHEAEEGGLEVRAGCDGERLEHKPGGNKLKEQVNSRGEEGGEKGIKNCYVDDSGGSVGRSKRSGSDYLGKC